MRFRVVISRRVEYVLSLTYEAKSREEAIKKGEKHLEDETWRTDSKTEQIEELPRITAVAFFEDD